MDDFGWIDIETYSKLDLKKVGAYVYSRHCEIILAGYAYGLEPVEIWEVGMNPAPVKELLALSRINVAHNVWFEFNCLEHAGWCDRPVSDWHCTMAQAYAHQLPASLEALGRAMGLPQDKRKKANGLKLMRLFSKPQRDGTRNTKVDLPLEWDEFRTYAMGDVTTMRENYKRMPRVNLDVPRSPI